MINCSGGQEIANFKYFEKNGYGKRFRTSFMFYRYMKKISDNPAIIDEMKKNMNKNKNHEAMEKLYKLAIKILNQ